MADMEDYPDKTFDIFDLKRALRSGQINPLENIEKINSTIVSNNASGEREPPVNNSLFEQKFKGLEKSLNQEITALRSQFSVFIQALINQEKSLQLAEVEHQKTLEELKNKVIAALNDIKEVFIQKNAQDSENLRKQWEFNELLRQEIAAIKKQVDDMYESEKAEVDNRLLLAPEGLKRVEEKQLQLNENIRYIMHVIEEYAVRPQSFEVQMQRRENFFMKEVTLMKEELAALRQLLQSNSNIYAPSNLEQNNASLHKENITARQTMQARSSKRRH